MSEIFKNLKIVEIASVLAGPAVGMFFAELGAHVLKVENKATGGDVTRKWHISSEDKSKTAAYYHSINFNKESVFWDLKNKEDYEKLQNELAEADVLISNFNVHTAKKFKVAYEQIKEQFPQLIYAELNGFAEDAYRPAYDIVLQAETGYLSMCGLNKTHKARMPVALIDILAAHQLKEGILIALLERFKTNKGCKISCSLEESAIASLANQATNYLIADHVPKPMGTKHPNIAPYGDIFNTSDGEEITLAIGSDKQFDSLCRVLGIKNIAADNRFHSNAERVKNRKELLSVLATEIIKIPLHSFSDTCKKEKIPMGHVKDLEAVFQSPVAKKMTLEDRDGIKRVSTIAFHIHT